MANDNEHLKIVLSAEDKGLQSCFDLARVPKDRIDVLKPLMSWERLHDFLDFFSSDKNTAYEQIHTFLDGVVKDGQNPFKNDFGTKRDKHTRVRGVERSSTRGSFKHR